MSGYKRATVTISEQEYRRLHEVDMQRRFGMRKEVESLDRETQLRAASAALEETQARQQHYDSIIDELGEEISRIEKSTSRFLLDSQFEFNKELSDQMENTSSEISAIYADLAENFEQRLRSQRAEFRRQLQSLSRKLVANDAALANKELSAARWITNAANLYTFIGDQFDADRFAPGSLEKIRQRLEFAQQNMSQGMPEAGLQGAQVAFLELSDLRMELETKTFEWQNQYQITFFAIRELLQVILANKNIPALDMDGKELNIPIDVDFWSNGALEMLLDEVRQLGEFLKQQHRVIAVDELKRIYNQTLADLKVQLENIIYESRLEAMRSQLRVNVADLALQALEQQGYSLKEAGFSNGDLRGAFSALLQNDDGSGITLRILPKPGAELTNDFLVISNDSAIRTAAELFARFQAIRSSLGKMGLEVNQVQSDSPSSDSKLAALDFNDKSDLSNLPRRITSHVRAD